MDDTGGFESTVPLRLEDLDPYAKKETSEPRQEKLVSDKDFVDLNAELDDLSSRLANADKSNPMNQNENIKTQRLRVNKPEVKSKKAVKETVKKAQAKQVKISSKQQPMQKKQKPLQAGVPSNKVGSSTAEHAAASVQHQTIPSTIEKSGEPSFEKRTKQPQTAHKHGWSMFVAMLSLIVGGTGVWMAWDASGQVQILEQKLQTIEMKMHPQIKAEQDVKKQRSVKTVEPSAAVVIKQKNQVEVKSKPKTKPSAASEANQQRKEITIKQVISPATPSVVNTVKPLGKGIWVVNVSSDKSFALADKKRQKLFESGVDSVVTQKNIKGSLWYRLQIIGFTSKKEAKIYLKKMQNNKHIEGAWVGKN